MHRYYMELPSSDYTTIQIAYDYIKKTYPHLTDGFSLCEQHIHDFKNSYPEPIFSWYDDTPFLGWGSKGGVRISFPDVNCIVLGDIE